MQYNWSFYRFLITFLLQFVFNKSRMFYLNYWLLLDSLTSFFVITFIFQIDFNLTRLFYLNYFWH